MSNKPKAIKPRKAAAIVPLVLKERAQLAAILNSELMQKVLANAAILKPGVFFSGAGTSAHQAKDAGMATLMSNNRLHEIRGWEQFETAIFVQVEDPKPAKTKINETYPEET
jgi:uncharacterized protein YbaA (DUF1428 family)